MEFSLFYFKARKLFPRSLNLTSHFHRIFFQKKYFTYLRHNSSDIFLLWLQINALRLIICKISIFKSRIIAILSPQQLIIHLRKNIFGGIIYVCTMKWKHRQRKVSTFSLAPLPRKNFNPNLFLIKLKLDLLFVKKWKIKIISRHKNFEISIHLRTYWTDCLPKFNSKH